MQRPGLSHDDVGDDTQGSSFKGSTRGVVIGQQDLVEMPHIQTCMRDVSTSAVENFTVCTWLGARGMSSCSCVVIVAGLHEADQELWAKMTGWDLHPG